MLYNIIKQELNLAFKRPVNLVNPLIFFIISISICAISFEGQISAGIIWLCLTFSILLGANNFFKEDFFDGNLEQLLISGNSFELIISAKILANWIIYCLPLIAFLPIFTIFFKLGNIAIFQLIIIFIIATLIITLISSLAAGLILSANSGHFLIAILVLPLTIPIIIFANGAFDNFDGDNYFKALKFLIALLIFLTPILILATSKAVKFNIRQ